MRYFFFIGTMNGCDFDTYWEMFFFMTGWILGSFVIGTILGLLSFTGCASGVWS